MSSLSRPVAALLLFSVLPFGASGCHEDGSGVVEGPWAVLPDGEETREVGNIFNEHAQDLLIAFNVQELLLFELPLGPALTAPWHGIPILRAGSCPTVDNDADLDGDGIPDDATFTFAGAACTTPVDPIGTFQQSGEVHVVDAGESPGYTLTYTDYRIRLDAFSGGDYSVITLNGTIVVTATPTTATQLESVVVTLEERQGGQVSTGRQEFDWTSVFEATPPEEVDLSIPLPSGVLTVSGSFIWTVDRSTFAFDIATPEALLFDASCPDGPEFLTGTVRAFIREGQGAYVDVRFVGCALNPEITLTLGG